jgi:maleate cis-trans isomerase
MHEHAEALAARVRDLIPRLQFGYILPVQIGEFLHYNFAQICPNDAVVVAPPLNLRSFSPEGVETAMEDYWRVFDFLVGRRVDRIAQGGIPITARLGRARVLALLEEGRRRIDVPVSADIEDSIAGLHEVGARRIALAAKWEPTLMDDVKRYFTEAGFDVSSITNDPHTATEVVALTPAAGYEIALELGRRAFRADPDADALMLAGGAWQNLPACMQLEAEFGRPVITNVLASIWAAMRQFQLEPRRRGFGIVFDRLFS